MPVYVAPGHALIGWSNGQLAAFAGAGIELIVALQTERHVGLLVGNVLLSGQWLIALQAAEMLNVVRGTFSCRVLLSEDQLIAGLAARYLQLNGQITTAVDLSVMEEVHQIRKQLTARVTLEAGGMPGDFFASTIRLDSHLAQVNWQVAIAAIDAGQ